MLLRCLAALEGSSPSSKSPTRIHWKDGYVGCSSVARLPHPTSFKFLALSLLFFFCCCFQRLAAVVPYHQESSSANLMIISDLDGTLLPAPKKVNGKVVHPIMSEGAAYAPLMRLLEFGATIVGVTGSRLTMHKPRFWDELPLSARKEGRVLLFCETGMVLYRPDENTGEPIEDEVCMWCRTITIESSSTPICRILCSSRQDALMC